MARHRHLSVCSQLAHSRCLPPKPLEAPPDRIPRDVRVRRTRRTGCLSVQPRGTGPGLRDEYRSTLVDIDRYRSTSSIASCALSQGRPRLLLGEVVDLILAVGDHVGQAVPILRALRGPGAHTSPLVDFTRALFLWDTFGMTKCVKPLRHIATSSTKSSTWSVLIG
jgi:hypothetical protein